MWRRRPTKCRTAGRQPPHSVLDKGYGLLSRCSNLAGKEEINGYFRQRLPARGAYKGPAEKTDGCRAGREPCSTEAFDWAFDWVTQKSHAEAWIYFRYNAHKRRRFGGRFNCIVFDSGCAVPADTMLKGHLIIKMNRTIYTYLASFIILVSSGCSTTYKMSRGRLFFRSLMLPQIYHDRKRNSISSFVNMKVKWKLLFLILSPIVRIFNEKNWRKKS